MPGAGHTPYTATPRSLGDRGDQSFCLNSKVEARTDQLFGARQHLMSLLIVLVCKLRDKVIRQAHRCRQRVFAGSAVYRTVEGDYFKDADPYVGATLGATLYAQIGSKTLLYAPIYQM